MRTLVSQLQPEKLLPRLFTGWCFAALIECLCSEYFFGTTEFATSVVLWRFLMVLIGVTAILTISALCFDTTKIQTRLLLGTAFAYLLTLTYDEHNSWFGFGMCMVLFFVYVYCIKDDKLSLDTLSLSRKQVYWLIGIAAAVFAVFSGTVTVFRYLNYTSSTFDLGIFSQMFHYMKETGIPYTTCERNELLSHFAVHVSPVWYVLLPGYLLFPSPVYLQIMQSLILASAVIPLYLLTKHFKLSNKVRALICVAFCFYPALTGGQFYDIHENLFLTPFLLWMVCFYEKKQFVPTFIFAVLTLLVKEDAAIYVAAFALYLLCNRKDVKRGVPLLLTAVVYFFLATALLTQFGDGAMTGTRFDAFLPAGSNSMLDVLKTVFLNPGLLFKELFTAEKIRFLLQMLLPLAFLPFFTKKVSHLLLCLPLLLVNLMPNWVYQYSIHFQYVFGSLAFVFYLTVLNVKELSHSVKKAVLPLIVMFSLLISCTELSYFNDNVTGYFENIQTNRTIAATLDEIPKDASVTATGYFLPAVSDRAVVYDFTAKKKTEYIVLDLRPGRENDMDQAMDFYDVQPHRYQQVAYKENIIVVYRDTQFTE